MSRIPKAILTVAVLQIILFCPPASSAANADSSATVNAQVIMPAMDSSQLAWLGDQIYRNECNRQVHCLLSWNAGEDFPSLGIGHFIWYRAGQTEAFTETFPALIGYLDEQHVAIPDWLFRQNLEQPWQSREEFSAAAGSPEQKSLSLLLQQTMALQTAFIIRRFAEGLDQLLSQLPGDQRAVLAGKIRSMLEQSPLHASYALIDYVHFKGEGTSDRERYQGQGWGLLQVLQAMPEDSREPLQDFVSSAGTVLAERVANAPPERNEQRWLAGWQNRLKTYLPADNTLPDQVTD